MKKLTLIPVLAAAALLASCGGNNNANCPVDSSAASKAAEATISHRFISPSVMTYSNFRPTYNYYLVTFAFETLDLYDDNTYELCVSSATFSAMVLPEEGNNASGNENSNSLLRYSGTYTATVDDLDDTSLNISLGACTRIYGVSDEKGDIDTDHWTEDMKKKNADVQYTYDPETEQRVESGRVEYATGAEYLAVHKMKAASTVGNISNGNLEYIALEFGE